MFLFCDIYLRFASSKTKFTLLNLFFDFFAPLLTDTSPIFVYVNLKNINAMTVFITSLKCRL